MKPPGASPYDATDPRHHAEELGRLDADEVHEFYHPFAMLPSGLELVRVVSPAYGAMDMVVLLDPKPVRVYVNTEAGERYLRERYPPVRRFRVPEAGMRLVELDRGETIIAELVAENGPLRELSLTIRAEADAAVRAERYEGHSVWGSDLACHGVDLRQAATCRGLVRWEGGRAEAISAPATIFRGSYGKIAPLR